MENVDPVTLTFYLLLKKLYLALTGTERDMAFKFRHGYSLWHDLSVCTQFFDPVTLTSNFDLLVEKF